MTTGICFQYAASASCAYGDKCKFKHVRTTSANSTPRNTTGGPKSRRAPRKTKKVLSTSAASFTAFFENYYEFDYDPTQSVTDEFFRMCDTFDWDKGNPERQEAHEAFKDALVQVFNEKYGTDENDIESWKSLCHVLKIGPIPDTLEDCRSAVLEVHVNLVDLVESDYRHVRIFRDLDALREYTVHNGKYFPKENAYAGGLLRYLLREIKTTYKGDKEHVQAVDIRSTIDSVLNRRRK